MEPVKPILVADLFPGLHAELIALLRGLAQEDWSRPTVAGAWTVKDVAAHLLDVQLRRLSAQRDGARLPPSDQALARMEIAGDRALGEPVARMLAVMA
jgi:hypothetical protein